jgi:hypothetical protein
MKYKIKIIIKNLLGHSLKIMSYFFVQWIYGQMCQSAKAQKLRSIRSSAKVPNCCKCATPQNLFAFAY